jgi:hypothetical protein
VRPVEVWSQAAEQAGAVSGRARVIKELVLHPDVQPRSWWQPMPAAVAAVFLAGRVGSDGGSLGQHAASTARECGIPAVVETQTPPGDSRWGLAGGGWGAGTVTIDDARAIALDQDT